MDDYSQYLRREEESLGQRLATEEERNRETDLEKEERLSQERIQQQLDKLCVDRKVNWQAVHLIGVDRFAFVKFSNQIPNCAAALDLNGPTVAIILAKKGVAIVNIAPFENFKTMENVDTESSAYHATKGLTHLMRLFSERRQTTFAKSDQVYGIIVAAEKNGGLVLNDAVETTKNKFAEFAFGRDKPVPVATYEPYYSHEPFGFQRSTVFVDGRSDEPKILLNGQLIWCKGQLVKRSAPSERLLGEPLSGNPPSSSAPLASSSSRDTTSRNPSGNPASSSAPLDSASSRNPASRGPSARDGPFVNTFGSDHPSGYQSVGDFEAQHAPPGASSSRTDSIHHTSSRDPPSDNGKGKGKGKRR